MNSTSQPSHPFKKPLNLLLTAQPCLRKLEFL